MVPGADRVDPDPARRVLQRGAAGQSDDAVFGRVVGDPARQADQSAEGGAVDDGSRTLGAHLDELVFHAGPHAAQVDGGEAVEPLGGLVGGIDDRGLDTGVVVGHIEASENLRGGCYGRRDLGFVSDVAVHRQYLVTVIAQLALGRGERVIDVRKGHRGARFGESPCGGQVHPRAGARDKRHAASEVVARIHALDLPLEQRNSGVKVLKRQMYGRANPDLPPPPRSSRRQAEREITETLGMLPLPLDTLPPSGSMHRWFPAVVTGSPISVSKRPSNCKNLVGAGGFEPPASRL